MRIRLVSCVALLCLLTSLAQAQIVGESYEARATSTSYLRSGAEVREDSATGSPFVDQEFVRINAPTAVAEWDARVFGGPWAAAFRPDWITSTQRVQGGAGSTSNFEYRNGSGLQFRQTGTGAIESSFRLLSRMWVRFDAEAEIFSNFPFSWPITRDDNDANASVSLQMWSTDRWEAIETIGADLPRGVLRRSRKLVLQLEPGLYRVVTQAFSLKHWDWSDFIYLCLEPEGCALTELRLGTSCVYTLRRLS